ncbi:MAG TPA: hypothetical protein VFT15_13580 [Chitinophagaceae bacterium]|nr:hypothetical protein [Chitinophagaceae bacterium]
MVKILLALSFLFTAVTLQCAGQDISGFWKGTLSMRGCFPENNIELQINAKGEILIGDSYHYQDIDNYVKKNFTGSFDKTTKKLTVREGLVTTYHIPQRCVICVKTFELVYSREGKLETLKGYWSGNVLNTLQSCDGGSIILTRIKESAFKEIPEIKVDTGTIRLDFYDNAQIDGDSITVLVDKQVVLTHQRLTAKALTTYVKIDLNNTFHEIEMVAENLGSIPPNTAILIITAGKNRHQLSLSSSETKSARVRIVYDQATSKVEQTVAVVKKEPD